MKYFIYISDTKVDMLFPQIPDSEKKIISKEFKVDAKLFVASRKTETRSFDDSISRLQAVIDYIDKHETVGTIAHPGDYFRGTL
jgi:hypothetical protein